MKPRRVHEFTIGDRLRKAREQAGYDQRGLEEASGISRATISAYELGKSTPRRAYLSIWANVTDTDLDWLTDGLVRSPDDTEKLTDPKYNDPITDPEAIGAEPSKPDTTSEPPVGGDTRRGADKSEPRIIRGRGPRITQGHDNDVHSESGQI